jgi:hypothetical protein
MDKMKEKLPGMASKKPVPSIEIEMEGEEEETPEAPVEGDEEEIAVGDLAQFSDEELKAELEKRGMQVSAPKQPAAPMPAEEEEA